MDVRTVDADAVGGLASAMAACEDARDGAAWDARAIERYARGGVAALAVVGAYDGRDGTLVGWACASSDGATVATIDRVCVRRDRRRRGVGTALVVLLGKVLFEREIYDVCAATPRALGETLFSDAGFEDDASVYMRYRGEMLDE